MPDIDELRLGSFFVALVKRLQLPLQFIDVEVGLSPAHGQAVADEELQEIMEQIGDFLGEGLKLLPRGIPTLVLVLMELALDKVVNELGAGHLAPVLVDHFNDVFFDHHNQVVFIQQQGSSHRFLSNLGKTALKVQYLLINCYTQSITGA